MAARDRNLNIGITSSFDGSGFKSAEQSARVIERELNRQEQQTRQLANMQTQAAREMAAEEARRAAAVEAANQRQRDAMEKTGRAVLGVSAAAAAGFALTAKAAIDWESDWAGVTKTVDGSAEELAVLEGQLRGLARTLPATHGEIAAVAEAAGQLGIERESVAGFTRTMIDLGETTNLSADEAATALAQLMNIMGTSTDDVDRLGATIVALGNNGASTEAEIVSMAQRMAGAGALIGATEGEVLALSSALASMGVTAELGGGAASRILQDLYSSVQDGGEALEGFAEVAGVSAEEFARAFEEDPVRALAMFADGLNGVEASGGNVVATLADLGIRSTEEQRVMLQLKSNTDLLTDSLDLQSQAWDENTALVDEANKRYQTTEARLQIARNQINDAAIDIGGNFLPMVAQAAEAVGALATWFGNLPAPVQQAVTVIGVAGTAIGLVGGAALIAVPKLRALQMTITDLHGGASRLGRAAGGMASVLTGPWGLAIAGAVTAVTLWATAQGRAQQMTQSLADTLDVQTGAITDNTTAWIQSELTKDQSFGIRNTKSMAEAAKEMGISLETLTRAYEGQPDAIRQAQAAANEYAENNWSVGLAADSMAQRFNQNIDDQARRLDEARQIQEAKQGIDKAATTQQGELADQYAGANPLIDEQGDLLGDSADAADQAKEALDALVEAMNDLNNPTLDLRDATREWEAQLDAVTASLEEHGRTLDVTTEAGRANQEALDGLAKAGAARAEALLQETGSEAAFRASLEESRQALYDTATQYGMTEEEAWSYVDSVLAIPEAAYTDVDADTGNARAALNGYLVELDAADGTVTINGNPANAEQTLGELIGNVDTSDGTVTINGQKVPAEITLRQLLSLINGSSAVTDILGNDQAGRATLANFLRYIGSQDPSVTLTVNTRTAADQMNTFLGTYNGRRITTYNEIVTYGQGRMAAGGVVEFYAGGGLRENHVAQVLPAGAMRVWAEPETGGEAYIPLAPAKRARSEAVLEDVAHRFGMYVGRFAQGAVIAQQPADGARSSAGPSSPRVTIGQIITRSNPREIVEEIDWRERTAPLS